MVEAVPLRVGLGRQAEVSGQVDDANLSLEQRRCELRARPMRKREERDIHTVGRTRLGRLEDQIRVWMEMRIDIADALAGPLSGRH
jgi:hypothetical protein